MILKTLGILTAITLAISFLASDVAITSTASKFLAPLIVLTCLFGIRPLVDYLKKHGTFDEFGNSGSGDSAGSHGDSNCSTDNSSGDCSGGDGSSGD